jgi:hypothetical protein
MERRLQDDSRFFGCSVSKECRSSMLKRFLVHKMASDGKCTQKCVTRIGVIYNQGYGWLCGSCNSKRYTAIIGPNGGKVTIPNITSLVIPKGTFNKNSRVTLEQTSDPALQLIFDETTSMFRVDGRLSYEIKFFSDRAPLVEYINMTMNVPDALYNPQGDNVEVFALSENVSPDDGPFSIFI